MFGAEKLLAELLVASGPGIRIVRAPCVGRCDTAPMAEVGHNFVDHANVHDVMETARRNDAHVRLPTYVEYKEYVSAGGYQLLSRLRSGALATEDLLKVLDDSSLRAGARAFLPAGNGVRF
jgi:formate dehydrogenase